MYKLVDHTNNDAHREKFGDWGSAPPGWREITEAEFAVDGLTAAYSPVAMEYRQFPYGGTTIGVHLWFMHDDTGYSILQCQREKRVRFFRFGCEHDYEEISRPAGHRSGIHTERCRKCKRLNSYDTSD